jgi:hypothetical protein
MNRRVARHPPGALETELVSAVFDAASRHLGAFPAAWYTFSRSTNIAKEEAAKREFRRRRRSSAAAS